MRALSRVLAAFAAFTASVPGAAAPGAAAPPPAAKETPRAGLRLFVNGTVVTVDGKMSEAQAVAVRDGRIVVVGTNEEVLKLKTPEAAVVDLAGKTLMPGFVEVHTHPILKMVVESYTVDIRPTTGHTDGAAIWATIRETVAKAKPGQYLVFFGWDPLLQKGLKNPTRKELDAIAPDNPLFLWGTSVHIGFANTAAFRYAGIDRNTSDPTGAMGGTFGRDADGELNGRIDQGGPIAMLLKPYLTKVIGDPQQATDAVYRGWLANARDGVTTVSDAVLLDEAMLLYGMVAGKQGSIRVRGYAIDYQKYPPGRGTEMDQATGGKLFVDGSPWTGTITMTKPYLVNHTTVKVMDTPAGYVQKPYVSQAELDAFVGDILRTKRSAAIHAEGDAAIEMALDAVEKGLRAYPTEDHRIRLEHAPMIRDDQLARAKRLGVQVSFLMAHVRYWGDVVTTLVGEERGERWCPVGSAKKAGVNYSFHFDGPTSPNRPLETLQTATTRRTVRGRVLGPSERISVDDAIRGYTVNAAYQLFLDKEVGSIEVGKAADLIVLSENPRKVDPEKISGIKVLATYVNGKEYWREGM